MTIDPENFAVPFSGGPVYLLADSQLLFASPGGRPLLAAAVDAVESAEPRAAYVGAANGDQPEFYSIFEGAMEMIGVRDRRMILSDYSAEDRAYLRSADLIVLAGGDVGAGLHVLRETGMDDDIDERRREGVVLVGVSAGAVHLGSMGWLGDAPAEGELVGTLGIVPFPVDAHDEEGGWRRLRQLLVRSPLGSFGIGVPAGGGVVHHPDGTLEPVGKSAVELRVEEDRIVESILYPPDHFPPPD
ncbi:MAG TPA: Type 1 glutamine amidotransferase-like domain-containing protein [Longimicrobium sp.]|jgi:cyanophycinase-like exopeptidase|nr:Type 1 glutamine amidotransferase-like domain-containing protein [Longimicrobium sp.]